MKSQKGFTLMELMVVVAIIAILASIAIPSYGDYVTRGKLKEAFAELSTLRVRMEQYFQDNRTYVGACQNNTVAPLPSGNAAKYFTYSCPTLTANTFILRATGVAAQGTGSFQYSLTEANAKTTDSVPSTGGWKKPAPNNCWITAKGGTC